MSGQVPLRTLFVLLSLSLVALLLAATPARAATYTVTSVADTDDGSCDTLVDCTLREAINAANASAGVVDAIDFDIAPGGAQTIALAGALPDIVDRVTIDGTTQPGGSGGPMIQVDGAAVTSANGLRITATSPSTVRGLSLTNHDLAGVRLESAAHVVELSHVGLANDGSTPGPNGIGVDAAGTGSRVGAVDVGNVISSNSTNGVVVRGASVQVVANRIGTDATGAFGRGNGADGIDVEATGQLAFISDNVVSTNGAGGSGGGIDIAADEAFLQFNMVGTTSDGLQALGNAEFGLEITGQDAWVNLNTVAANGGNGMQIMAGGEGATVARNRIGVSANGTALGNGYAGVYYSAPGPATFGPDNRIAHNGNVGVSLTDGPATVTENLLYENGGPGMLLDGMQPANDVDDVDIGTNGHQNHPEVVQAMTVPVGTRVSGMLDVPSGATGPYRLEFFTSGACDPSGSGEAGEFLGAVQATATGDDLTFDLAFTGGAVGEMVTATATNPAGETSVLSACRQIRSAGGGGSSLGSSGGGEQEPAPAAPPAPPPGSVPSDPPPPVTGKAVNVSVVRGHVLIRLPDGRFVRLRDAQQIPIGSVVDTRKGAVRLFSTGRNGRVQSAVFSTGMFRVTQSRGRRPMTTLTLVEQLARCPKRGAAARSAARRSRKRRLWGDGQGDFRTRGRRSAAIVTGTKWLVEDSCAGTLTRVVRGTVHVRDFKRRRTIRVRAGGSYRAR